MGKKWQHCQISFSWGPKLPRMVTVATKLKDSFSWKKLYEKPRQCVKKQRYHVANKGPSSQGYGFSSGHVWMWFGSKRKWAPKNWCFWTVVLRKSLESPLDCRELKPVTPKGHQPWIRIERTDAETEALILWPPSEKKPTLWKWPWCCGRLRAGGEGGNGGWDGCLASLTQRTWVWANLGDSEVWGRLACYSSQGHR